MATEKSFSRPRPAAVTVLCVILFMIGASQTVHAFAAFAIHPGVRTLYGILFSGVTLLAYYGLWNMRRWSVFLFAAAWGVNIFILAIMGADGAFMSEFRFWACVILLTAALAVVVPHWRFFKTPQPQGGNDSGPE